VGAVAIAVLWAGYSIGMWGYCMIRGYCVSPANVVDPGFPGRMAHAGGREVPQTQAVTGPSNAAANPPASQPGTSTGTVTV